MKRRCSGCRSQIQGHVLVVSGRDFCSMRCWRYHSNDAFTDKALKSDGPPGVYEVEKALGRR